MLFECGRKEVRVPGENTCRHGEEMQKPHTTVSDGNKNQRPPCCQVTVTMIKENHNEKASSCANYLIKLPESKP